MNKKVIKQYRTFFVLFVVFTLLFVAHTSVGAVNLLESKRQVNGSFLFQKGVFTHHWNDKFNDDTDLYSLEYYSYNNWLYGVAKFQNSFYQPSWYVYTGKDYSLKEISKLQIRGKVTAGIMHGYDDENGKYDAVITKFKTFPIIIPSLKIVYRRFELDVVALAHEGFMITTGIRF